MGMNEFIAGAAIVGLLAYTGFWIMAMRQSGSMLRHYAMLYQREGEWRIKK